MQGARSRGNESTTEHLGLSLFVVKPRKLVRAFDVLQRVAHHGKPIDLSFYDCTDSMDLFAIYLASSKIQGWKDAQSHQLETESYDQRWPCPHWSNAGI